MTKSLILGSPGEKYLLLGNEAVARGAIEGGVGVATAYPGTPSTEIIESLIPVADEIGMYVEWSTNEKVALEVAFAASLSGIRSLVAMKHVGLNVAMDSLVSLGYTGVIGGMIIVSAEDPSMHSSQNEQDNRWIGILSYIPVFEPWNQQEAKDIVPYLLDFSETYQSPVILRLTTRLSHTRGVVKYGQILRRNIRGTFSKDVKRWVLIPAHARERRKLLLDRWDKIKNAIDQCSFNWNIINNKNTEYGIIAVGLSYGYVLDAIRYLNVKNMVNILKLSTSVPIPEKLCAEFITKHRKILIVEEVEGVVETQIKNILYNINVDVVEFHGKDLLGYYGELTLDRVINAIAKFLNIKSRYNHIPKQHSIDIPSRPPVLCPGCPHRATFFAIRKAVNMCKVNAIYPGDIGCYTLGVNPPYKMVDTTISMGSSIGIACGLARFQENIVIATIGDSTFYHAGIPGLINAVYNQSPFLLIVMDNEITAMTGDQPNPGTGYTALGKKTKRVLIEDIARSIGVEFVEVVDPYQVKKTINTIKNAIDYIMNSGKPAVVIARRICSLEYIRKVRKQGLPIEKYTINKDKCTFCKVCIDLFACPAIQFSDDGIFIDASLCTGCGVCAEICPVKAIIKGDNYGD